MQSAKKSGSPMDLIRTPRESAVPGWDRFYSCSHQQRPNLTLMKQSHHHHLLTEMARNALPAGVSETSKSILRKLFPACLLCSEPNKARRFVRGSYKVPGALYERAAATEEIKATLRGVWTSVFFLPKVLFG